MFASISTVYMVPQSITQRQNYTWGQYIRCVPFGDCFLKKKNIVITIAVTPNDLKWNIKQTCSKCYLGLITEDMNYLKRYVVKSFLTIHAYEKICLEEIWSKILFIKTIFSGSILLYIFICSCFCTMFQDGKYSWSGIFLQKKTNNNNKNILQVT